MSAIQIVSLQQNLKKTGKEYEMLQTEYTWDIFLFLPFYKTIDIKEYLSSCWLCLYISDRILLTIPNRLES